MSNLLEQKRDRAHSRKPPSADGKEGIRTPQTERQTDKKTKKEQAEKRKIREERKQLAELSQKELLKVASTVQKICLWKESSVESVSLRKG